MAILGTAILAATALLVGWRVFALRSEAARLDQDLRSAQMEQQRLRSILLQVQDFEQRKQQLQQRVALIEELRKGQTGPVRMLDEMSRALPDRLWLTQVAQEPAGVKVDGRTTSLTSLSDFVGNLETSGYFARPVEIRREPGREHAGRRRRRAVHGACPVPVGRGGQAGRRPAHPCARAGDPAGQAVRQPCS